MKSRYFNLKQDFSIVQLPSEADSFADLDDNADNSDAEDELSHLVQGQDGACTLPEIIAAENDVPICSEFADDTWDETFMNEFQPNSSAEAQVSSDENECEQPLNE